MDRCWGVSPYIVDQPYAPARLFSWQTEPGRTQLQMPDVASLWFFTGGYQTDVKLDWHNVDTGERGTLYDNATVSNPGNDVVTFDLNSGPGDVEFTVSAVNSIPLWSIPTRRAVVSSAWRESGGDRHATTTPDGASVFVVVEPAVFVALPAPGRQRHPGCGQCAPEAQPPVHVHRRIRRSMSSFRGRCESFDAV